MDLKKQKKEITLFLSLLILNLILMGLDKGQFLDWLKRPLEHFSSPVKLGFSQFQKSRKPKPAAVNTPESTIIYEQENADLKAKIIILEQQNTAMKKLLAVPLPANWQYLLAQVLGVKNGILTIDQGKDSGVSPSQTVVVENFLVGRVSEVNPALSRVILVNQPKNSLKAKILESRQKGTVKADVNGVLILDEVLTEAVLSPGQIVVTSGEEEIYPPNLLIGKIKSVDKEESAVFQKAVIEPFLAYQELETVFVVIKK